MGSGLAKERCPDARRGTELRHGRSPHLVVHVATAYGLLSEGFVIDAIESVDAAGCTSVVVALAERSRVPVRYPPADRMILVASPRPWRRALAKLTGSGRPDLFGQAAARELAAQRPDVIHAHFGWSGLYALPLAARLRLPLVVTFHASDVTVLPRAMNSRRPRAVYESLFARLDVAIVVSRFIERELRQLGWTGPTVLIPAGVWVSRFPFRDHPARGGLKLLFVGRLVRRKGLDVLLRALAELVAARYDVSLEVIGDGAERAALETLATSLGVAARVEFRGAQPSMVVVAALRSAHIFVMPSRVMPNGEVESSPVVIKEALAVGVQIVATDTGGTREVVPPAVVSELVAEGDVNALVARLRCLLDERGSWALRAREGRRWAEEQFDWPRLGRATAAVYDELTEG